MTLGVQAQSPASAKPGTLYGAEVSKGEGINVEELQRSVSSSGYTGKLTGTVVEVCQEKGCWMKLKNSEGANLMVKFKDYGFFMPKDIVGKNVIMEGEANVKEVSVKQQRHYAEDAGKSKDEIKSITKPKKEIQFVASGVKVI